MIEQRFCGELRAEGRQLIGVVMPYGEVSPDFQELFEPGAFGPEVSQADIILNSMHQRPQPLARTNGGLVLIDTPQSLNMRAELPNTAAASDVLELVRANVLRGLSVEFDALEERFQGGIRRISRAKLGSVGVVDRPGFIGAAVQARAGRPQQRQRRRVWL